MNKFSPICLLLFLACSSVSCVQLNYICPNGTFTFNGVLVNAFYAVRSNFTYRPIGHYLIDQNCNRRNFDNSTNYAETNRIKKDL